MPTLVADTVKLCGILDDLEAMPVGEPGDQFHRRGVTVDADRHDRRSSVSHQRVQRVDVQIEGVRIGVDEHRPQTGEHRCGGRREEREGRNQDLAAPGQVERQQGKEQAEGSVGRQHPVSGAGLGQNLVEEPLRVRTLGQPVAANRVGEAIEFVGVEAGLHLSDPPCHSLILTTGPG